MFHLFPTKLPPYNRHSNSFPNFSSETLIIFKVMLLKEVFKAKGIKQKWLASKMGVSEVTVSNWAKGKSMPSQKHLEKLSAILGVTVKDLTN